MGEVVNCSFLWPVLLYDWCKTSDTDTLWTWLQGVCCFLGWIVLIYLNTSLDYRENHWQIWKIWNIMLSRDWCISSRVWQLKLTNWIKCINTSFLSVLSAINVLMPTPRSLCLLFVVYFLQEGMLTQSEGQSKGDVFWFLGSSSSCCSFDQFLGKQQCKRNFEWSCWKRSSWKTPYVYCKYYCLKSSSIVCCTFKVSVFCS